MAEQTSQALKRMALNQPEECRREEALLDKQVLGNIVSCGVMVEGDMAPGRHIDRCRKGIAVAKLAVHDASAEDVVEGGPSLACVLAVLVDMVGADEKMQHRVPSRCSRNSKVVCECDGLEAAVEVLQSNRSRLERESDILDA